MGLKGLDTTQQLNTTTTTKTFVVKSHHYGKVFTPDFEAQ